MEKGRGDDGKHEKQRGKMKMSSSENQMVVYPQQPPPHHNCPRCNSSHTKFCYYNNYSLTQPRYFCKTCRRYWTHGGSLRNVPVGGGSRRGRRDKGLSSSNGEGSSRSTPPPQPLSMKLSSMVSLLSNSIGVLPSNNQPMRGGSSSAMTPMSSFYNSSGGFTSSLAAMQNLNLTPPPQGINRPLRIDGSQMCGSGFGNMSVLQDFNRLSTMRPQQAPMPQNQQPNNFQNMNNRGKEPMYPYDQSFYQATRPMGGSNGNQSFSNNNNHHMGASSSTFWNGSNNTANTSNGNMSGSSVDPNEWPDDLPDFDPPDI